MVFWLTLGSDVVYTNKMHYETEGELIFPR